jgi:hypothetical protein
MSPVLSQFVVPVTSVHKVEADGVEVFYRAAGDPSAPVLLLHKAQRCYRLCAQKRTQACAFR